MTDRELLEMSAEAAGFEWRWYVAPVGQLFQIKQRDIWVFWTPLTDDGDALRLAVKLDFRIDVDRDRAWTAVMTPRHLGIDSILQTDDNGDPYAATRRAIVRAAAEIGKAKRQPSQKSA